MEGKSSINLIRMKQLQRKNTTIAVSGSETIRCMTCQNNLKEKKIGSQPLKAEQVNICTP